MTSQSLNIGMKQSMNLTASLHQSINILQMSSIELAEMISREMETNPFLESASDNEAEDSNKEERFDNISVISNRDDNFNPISQIPDEQSLTVYVMEQVGMVIADPIQRMIALYIVNLLQESGYIELDIAKAQKDLKASEVEILSVLYKLQTIEPTGIFARNLQECLALQLKEKGEYNEIFQIILDNLNYLATHDMTRLAKICRIKNNELAEYVQEIKLLNPKPCASFGTERLTSRVADVILTVDEMNEITVRINENAVPDFNVKKDYYSQIKRQLISSQDKDFASNYYHSANNVMRAVTQRLKTIKEVATVIADKQKDFFLKGVMYLKPMTLAEIAYTCGMNESTISRATSNKYIQTPTGIYDMRFFFSSRIQSKNSAVNVSSTKVKEIIKSIIDSEDASHIYSDDDIVAELAKFNVNIARRTVAKYREAMGINTSNMRKRISRNILSSA